MDLETGAWEAELCLAVVKAALKERGIGYREVAGEFGVSLPTVKRMLNKASLPLDRLMSLCRLAGLGLGELAERVERQRPKHATFTEEQDRLFAERPSFLSYFLRLSEGESPLEIEASAGLSRLSSERYLRGLEAVGLLEREAGLRARLRVEPPFGFGPGSRVLRERQAAFMRRVTEQVVLGETDGVFSVMKPLRLSEGLREELRGELLALLDRYSFFSSRARDGAEDWALAVALARGEADGGELAPIVELEREGGARSGDR